jgi:8-amino-7-oxononanoate synthase
MRKIESLFADFVSARRKNSLYRHMQGLQRQTARIVVAQGREYINFAGNDYLGLSFHPAVIERARDWTARYGAGAGASRLVTGTLDRTSDVEEKLAAFKGAEAAILMVSGFQANVSVLPALFDKHVLGDSPLVFADRLNHASMHLGCAAAGVRQNRYRHNDMAHLESLLKKHEGNALPKFILTESVFSMDGDIAPMSELVMLAHRYDCFLVVDEAHATGVLGPCGRGLADGADLVIGTFSKAMGSFGAYVSCSAAVRDYLVNKCAGLIYATALPAGVYGAMDAALDLMPEMDAARARLARMAAHFRAEMTRLKLETGLSATQIVPVITGSAQDALDICAALRGEGLWATAIRSPTVPIEAARVRFAFSAAHSDSDLEKLCATLAEKCKRKAA